MARYAHANALHHGDAGPSVMPSFCVWRARRRQPATNKRDASRKKKTTRCAHERAPRPAHRPRPLGACAGVRAQRRTRRAARALVRTGVAAVARARVNDAGALAHAQKIYERRASARRAAQPPHHLKLGGHHRAAQHALNVRARDVLVAASVSSACAQRGERTHVKKNTLWLRGAPRTTPPAPAARLSLTHAHARTHARTHAHQ